MAANLTSDPGDDDPRSSMGRSETDTFMSNNLSTGRRGKSVSSLCLSMRTGYRFDEREPGMIHERPCQTPGYAVSMGMVVTWCVLSTSLRQLVFRVQGLFMLTWFPHEILHASNTWNSTLPPGFHVCLCRRLASPYLSLASSLISMLEKAYCTFLRSTGHFSSHCCGIS